MAHLKVLLTVHQFFPRGYHGTERYTLDLATELARAGPPVAGFTTLATQPRQPVASRARGSANQWLGQPDVSSG